MFTGVVAVPTAGFRRRSTPFRAAPMVGENGADADRLASFSAINRCRSISKSRSLALVQDDKIPFKRPKVCLKTPESCGCGVKFARGKQAPSAQEARNFHLKNALILSINPFARGLCLSPSATLMASSSRRISFCRSVSFTGVSTTTWHIRSP